MKAKAKPPRPAKKMKELPPMTPKRRWGVVDSRGELVDVVGFKPEGGLHYFPKSGETIRRVRITEE